MPTRLTTNYRLLRVLFLLVLLRAADGPALGVQQVDRLSAAMRLTAQGKGELALAELDLYKQEQPRDPRAFLYSAVALLQLGRRLDAEVELASALGAPPDTEADLLALANTLDQLGRPELAAEALRNRMQAGKLGAAGMWLLSDLFLRLHKAEEASKVLDSFAALKPGDPRVPLRRGQIELMAGHLERALDAFEDARESNPSDPEALFGIASVLYQENNPEAAVKIFPRLLQARPSDSRSLHLLGLTLAALERYSEAAARLSEATEIPDCEARVYFDLGNVRRKAGNDEGARQALTRYQELQRKSEGEKKRTQLVAQLLNEGRQELQRSQMAEAESSFQRVLEVDPENWSAHSFLAKILLSQGRPRRAIGHIAKMREIAPESSEGHYLNAFVLYRTRNYQKALEAAQMAKSLRPSYPELRNLLGNIFFAVGRRAEALQEYRAAMLLDPEQETYRLNYETLAKPSGS